MPEILFIGHRIPFPPDRGDKIRSHHILKALAKIAPVHVATFADDEQDFCEEAELAGLARSYCLVRRSKPLALAGIQAVATGKPVSEAAFADPALAAYVSATLRQHNIGTIYVFSGQMGQYVPADFTGRVIADFVDVDSAKFEAYAGKGNSFMGWVNAREARVLGQTEARLAQRADVSLLISAEEARLFTDRLAPGLRHAATVQVLGNGIDSSLFNPVMVTAEPRLSALAGPKMIFTGQMDYDPNITAAVRMARRIMPMIRKIIPDASFHVVGRNPDSAVQSLANLEGCHVWGRVDDIRTWLKAADIAVVPLEIARGVQNKVLEAMAMMLPVVLTSAAATGIPAIDGSHFAIADSDDAFAEAAVRLLKNKAAAKSMGVAARFYVNDQQSWKAALAALSGLVRGPDRRASDGN